MVREGKLSLLFWASCDELIHPPSSGKMGRLGDFEEKKNSVLYVAMAKNSLSSDQNLWNMLLQFKTYLLIPFLIIDNPFPANTVSIWNIRYCTTFCIVGYILYLNVYCIYAFLTRLHLVYQHCVLKKTARNIRRESEMSRNVI